MKDAMDCWNGVVPTASASKAQIIATTSPIVTTEPTKSTALCKVLLLLFYPIPFYTFRPCLFLPFFLLI